MNASIHITMLMLAFDLSACSEAALESAKTAKAEATVPQDANSESNTTTGRSDTEADKEDPKTEDSSAEKATPVTGFYLACALDVDGVPSAATEAPYGCRLEFEGKRISLPANLSAEIQLFNGTTKLAATMAPAPANSAWHWMVRTAATDPCDAKLYLRNVSVATSPLVVSEGTASYVFAAEKKVEGCLIQWLPNAGVAELIAQADKVRATGALTFPTVFPKYVNVNAPASTGVPIIVGFLIGTDRLTCRYKPEPGIMTKYTIDLTSCRRGPTDLSRIDETPVRSDLNNPVVTWNLNTVIVGATQVYSDVVASTQAQDPGPTFLPRLTLREVKAP